MGRKAWLSEARPLSIDDFHPNDTFPKTGAVRVQNSRGVG